MALVGTLVSRTKKGRQVEAVVDVAISGNYATDGDVIDFEPVVGYVSRQPTQVSLGHKAGFVLTYDIPNKKMLVYVATTTGTNTPLQQHTAVAYVAGLTGTSVRATVTFG